MNLIKCPRCGEDYSPSYRRCPFCEEGDHSRKTKHRGGKDGRRVSDHRQTHSARGAMAAVLVVVLLLLSWSLFGDRLAEKLGSDKANDSALTDDRNTPANDDAATDPDDAMGEITDPNAPVVPNGGSAGGETGEPDPGGTTTPVDATKPDTTTPDTTTPGTTQTVDASSLSVKTNVGTTLSRDASGSFDCTIRKSESIRLSVSGTDAAVSWSVTDASVLTISSDGKISPLKTGTTDVTASVGGAALTIIVRVVN